MNFDSNGLPVNLNPDGTLDANDQLNRIGMILASGQPANPGYLQALKGPLQPNFHGEYTRFIGGNPNTVSADQLIPVMAYWANAGEFKESAYMFYHMLVRLGFAQDTHDTDPTKTAWKLPDFMLFRAMPILSRASLFFYPITLIFDLFLPILVLSDYVYKRTTPDAVDINCTLTTLATCRQTLPTPFSMLAAWLFSKTRPTILADMQRYHRAPAGNPEIAEMWEVKIKEVFSQ